jgi:hypothetical protein
MPLYVKRHRGLGYEWVLEDRNVSFCPWPSISALDRERLPDPETWEGNPYYRLPLLAGRIEFAMDRPLETEVTLAERIYRLSAYYFAGEDVTTAHYDWTFRPPVFVEEKRVEWLVVARTWVLYSTPYLVP